MITKQFGIFGKVFLYTLIFLLLAISITGLVFAQQFKDFYDYLQVQQYTAVFEPLKTTIIKDKGIDQIVKSANEFHDKNQSFAFNIETQDGYVVYTTVTGKATTSQDRNYITGQSSVEGSVLGKTVNPYTAAGTVTIQANDTKLSTDAIERIKTGLKTITGSAAELRVSPAESISISSAEKTLNSKEKIDVRLADTTTVPTTSMYKLTSKPDNIAIALDDGLLIRTATTTDSASLYKEFIKKAIFILFLLLCASIAGAVLFARGITNPIRRLADDTRKMACLEEVSLPVSRNDEVGQLARDVHSMYEKLKDTISDLQAEIIREKEMEENQRYFFSAASHELKTPIAATSALLEGMLAGIGDYCNHPKYLRECLNMMRAQNRIITEILEIVKLSDERIVPHKENVTLLNVIHTILPEYNTLADKKEQSILIDVPETASCYTDRKMISNVLSNVMMNAIQNSASGETIRIWSEMREPDVIRICILNTNAHIDEETKAKLFEPFYRVDKARSRMEQRGGLGLTIVKKILDSLGVTFALETRNTDVIFWMDLPIREYSE